MFLTLLLVTFLTALLVSFLVSKLFERPIRQILARLVPGDLTGAWHRYLTFAIYVVGISGGVRIWSLEQYILPRGHDEPARIGAAEREPRLIGVPVKLSACHAGTVQNEPEGPGVR